MSEHSSKFKEMAERIELNNEQPFGGAVVIVPPEGEPVTLLLLDEANDSVGARAQFWGTVQARIAMAMKDLEAELRQGR
jgi:hypothetical protein